MVGTTVFVHGFEDERARWMFSETEAQGCGGPGGLGSLELMDGAVTVTPDAELPDVQQENATLAVGADVFEAIEVSEDDVKVCR